MKHSSLQGSVAVAESSPGAPQGPDQETGEERVRRMVIDSKSNNLTPRGGEKQPKAKGPQSASTAFAAQFWTKQSV